MTHYPSGVDDVTTPARRLSADAYASCASRAARMPADRAAPSLANDRVSALAMETSEERLTDRRLLNMNPQG